MSRYTIRPMFRGEVDLAIEWAAKEGWNPGLHDAECFYAMDPNGFFVGILDEEPISIISAVKYGHSFGFIGFYIVKPEYRNQGFGVQIWNEALYRLQSRTIGLDGVVAQQENYQRSGFQLAHRNIRYGGTGGGTVPTDPNLVNLSDVPSEEIVLYDRAFFPDDRRVFLQHWLTQPDSVAIGFRQHDQLMGYGVLRKCRLGYKIVPLLADEMASTETLLLALKSRVESEAPVYFDVPEVNPAAASLAEQYGMTPIFETARMYLGERPIFPIDRWFGVTTFELG
jgi:GNAT superfamily N-acetyltransferase